ncbi:2Fe-2S iron-sulfur cluster binding domain-containing protein [Halieaceae bacterium IMCC8485]|uniref:2Fe-2S iron-sulfur cluster binding domain-containing protein n=1 Tax=Candidatus Seongchinamella marina TaxID=2518990 RepID=A0ABT3SZV9_9GAMM|nr:2Fe-2S iron-sulfur cluster binding domain-containing protein [Candidatus Seongchinamella marina]MCX2975450.1 2Fe-2S iron-sulfur cluster binding domain-containing protein [Candidatus Seongchinamella marina]
MSYEVLIEPLGVTVEVEEGQTILDAALRQGVYLPHACGHGLCGTCKVDILEGDIEIGDEASPFALMDFERDEGKGLTCCCKPLSDLVIEADVEEEPDAQYIPVKDYIGTVVKLEKLTPRILGVFLEVEGDGLEFQSGQYANLHIPGLDTPRPFSMAQSPNDKNIIEFDIALIQGGEATTWIHENLKVGDTLDFSGPYGHFFIRTSDPKPLLFFGGGSGLSSPKSMVLDLLESGDKREIILFQGARNLQELYYRDLFLELERKHDNFTYIPGLSGPDIEAEWDGATGFVHEVAIEHFSGKFEGYRAYMCGPPPMIDACITALIRGRVFEKDMFMEKFLTAADGATEKTKSPLFKNI